MAYTFELLGISPALDFFIYQQKSAQPEFEQISAPQISDSQVSTEQLSDRQVEYVSSYQCTLDALIQSVETVPPERGWQLDQAVDTVVNFWLSNVEAIQHWKQRLADAGDHNLIVGRLADFKSLQTEFERLFG